MRGVFFSNTAHLIASSDSNHQYVKFHPQLPSHPTFHRPLARLSFERLSLDVAPAEAPLPNV